MFLEVWKLFFGLSNLLLFYMYLISIYYVKGVIGDIDFMFCVL